ncbi:MAG: hypothetical protein RIC55_21085 [Pirellulaceae bacterium]
MPNYNKMAMRAAMRIHRRLAHAEPPSASVGVLHATWTLVADNARKLRKAEARGWCAASRRVRADLTATLDQLRDAALDVQRSLRSPDPGFVMSPQQIYHDLVALYDEFEEVEIVAKSRIISVKTEAIQLQDLYLGPFKIVLHWDQFDERMPYEVVALDPQPASRVGDDVVHPHVQGEDLCEGEAKALLRSALRQGRLFDFFVIVRQTLQTYNPSSAYVAIDEWDGRRCADCDTHVGDEGDYSCEQCRCLVCDDCEITCEGCGGCFCGECMNRCEKCNQASCDQCLKTCGRCSASCCRECHENEVCKSCEETDSTATEAQLGDDAEAEVHPHVVGEAGVPA